MNTEILRMGLNVTLPKRLSRVGRAMATDPPEGEMEKLTAARHALVQVLNEYHQFTEGGAVDERGAWFDALLRLEEALQLLQQLNREKRSQLGA